MSRVLGRVVTGVHEVPRGPDVLHRISVKRSWLERGETIEFCLPRNLSCAACEGGGCDRCGRSGAISLRARGDVPEPVRLPLPRRTAEDMDGEPVLLLRVPEQGGLGEDALPRGLLLLQIVASKHSDAGVRKVRDPLGRLSLAPKPKPESLDEQPFPLLARSRAQSSFRWVFVAVAFLLGCVLALLAGGRFPR